MNFFDRRRPFIFVQELSQLSETKELLISKLQFLAQQLKSSQDAIGTSDLIIKEFSESYFLRIDLNIKIVYILIHLAKSSSIEWEFLKTLKNSQYQNCLTNEPLDKGFFLDTSGIYQEDGEFFLGLLKMEAIDISQWIDLHRLKSRSEAAGALFINDSFYYEYKQRDLTISPEFTPERLSQDKSFFDFIRKPIDLQISSSFLWNLLIVSKQHNNLDVVSEFIQNSITSHSALRPAKTVKQYLTKQQQRYLESFLEMFNTTKFLYKTVHDIKLFGEGQQTTLLPQLWQYYLLKYEGEGIKAPPSERNRVVNAILWIDLISYLCELELFTGSTVERKVKKDMVRNLERICEDELSILLEPHALLYIFNLDISIFSILVQKINALKVMPFYKNHYSPFMDKYFTFAA